MRQRLFLFFCGIMTLFLFGCRTGICSPQFASVEVLDENNEFVSECTFSAVYDGQGEVDLCCYSFNASEADEETYRFKFLRGRPCRWYDLHSNKFSYEVGRGKTDDEVIKKFRIRVSKEGYESVEYTPTVHPDAPFYYALDSIVLKKSDGTSGSEIK